MQFWAFKEGISDFNRIPNRLRGHSAEDYLGLKQGREKGRTEGEKKKGAKTVTQGQLQL